MKQLRKMGTIDLDMMEATPVVFRDHLYRMEYVHEHYYGNLRGETYYRNVDVATGAMTSPFGFGYSMGNLFVWENRAYLTSVRNSAVEKNVDNDAFYLSVSEDLVHWSEPEAILRDSRWDGYNTSICRADDRFLMVFELKKPAELVGIPFTMFFAESQDLRHWRVIEGASFGRYFYTGAPLLRWHGGWTYFFFLHHDEAKKIFETWVVRSQDLKHWDFAPNNPVLTPDARDKTLADGVKLRTDLYEERILNGVDINNSDMDMQEFKGKLYITYSWGNQYFKDNLAYAEFDGTEQEFCESFWK